MEMVGIVALLLTMSVTALDVVLGMFRRPIVGAYDLAGIGSGIAISFSIAVTSWKKQHIAVDTIFQKFPVGMQFYWNILLRIINAIFFILISAYLFTRSADLKRAGEVCASMPIVPLWPIALLLGIACLAQILVAVSEVVTEYKSRRVS